jgi:hypothetical protein
MKLVHLFAVAALLVACVKGITRDSKHESTNRFHRLGL